MDSPPAPATSSDDSEPVRGEAGGDGESAAEVAPEGAIVAVPERAGVVAPEGAAAAVAPKVSEKLPPVETGSPDMDEAEVEAAPVALPRLPRIAPPVVAPIVHRPPSTALLVSVAVVVAAADLSSKEWAKAALATPDLKRSGKHITAIPDYLDFIFAMNPGGAWSFLRGMSDGLRRPFFLFVSAAAIVFIVTVYRRLDRRQWAMRWGLPLALGGAIGNLVDRIRYGWVVDFIDMYWKKGTDETHWPTFNVADIAIVFGVGLMALDLLSLRRSHDAPGGKAEAETASDAA